MMARNLMSGPEPDDIMVGDPVRIGGKGKVGWVDSINGDHAVVAWSGDDRDILPLASLRRAPQRGAAYDSWRGA
jgi:hypothetical protein